MALRPPAQGYPRPTHIGVPPTSLGLCAPRRRHAGGARKDLGGTATHPQPAHERQGGGALVSLGIFGARVWFLQRVDGLWACVLAFFQGVFWPAFMVNEVFRTLAG